MNKQVGICCVLIVIGFLLAEAHAYPYIIESDMDTYQALAHFTGYINVTNTLDGQGQPPRFNLTVLFPNNLTKANVTQWYKLRNVTKQNLIFNKFFWEFPKAINGTSCVVMGGWDYNVTHCQRENITVLAKNYIALDWVKINTYYGKKTGKGAPPNFDGIATIEDTVGWLDSNFYKVEYNMDFKTSGKFYYELWINDTLWGFLDPWWDSAWSNSRPIKLTHNNGTHIFEPIFLNYSEIKTECGVANCSDIRIIYQNTTEIPYQFWWPQWNSTAAVNDTLVFLANTTNSDNTSYWIYYDNPAATTDATTAIFSVIETFTKDNMNAFIDTAEEAGGRWTIGKAERPYNKTGGANINRWYALGTVSNAWDVATVARDLIQNKTAAGNYFRPRVNFTGNHFSTGTFYVSMRWKVRGNDVGGAGNPDQAGLNLYQTTQSVIANPWMTRTNGSICAINNNTEDMCSMKLENNTYYGVTILGKMNTVNYTIYVDNIKRISNVTFRTISWSPLFIDQIVLESTNSEIYNQTFDDVLASTTEHYVYGTRSSSALGAQSNLPFNIYFATANNTVTSNSTPNIVFWWKSNKTATAPATLFVDSVNVSFNASSFNNTNTTLTPSTALTIGNHSYYVQINGTVSDVQNIDIRGTNLTIWVRSELNDTRLYFNGSITNNVLNITITDGYDFTSNTTPRGALTISLFSVSHPQRKYFLTLLANDSYNLTGWLLDIGSGQYIRFHVASLGDEPISSVKVTAQAFLMGAWQTVEQDKTDDSGTARLFLNPLTTYNIILTDGCIKNVTITPTSTDYYFRCDTAGSGSYAYDFEGIDYKLAFYPDFSDTDYMRQANFSIVDAKADLDYFGLRINRNGSVVYTANITTNTSGGWIAYNLNLSNLTSGNFIKFTFWWKRSQFDMFEGSQTSVLTKGTIRNTTVQNILMWLSDPDFATIGGQFAAQITAIIITAFGTALFGRRLGYYGAGFIAVAFFAIFMYVNWLPWQLFLLVTVGIVAVYILRR